MKNSVTFELQSGSPIEIVYGVSSETLDAIKSEHQGTEGYDWCILLDGIADQREQLLYGNDVDDAQLTITEQGGKKRSFRFLSEIDCEYEDDLSDVIQYNDDSFYDAGSELDPTTIMHVIVARLELKFRSWKSISKIEGDFDSEKVTVKIKNRDAADGLASQIYATWHSEFESSITHIYYDGSRISFEEDFTSYAPEFLCLSKTSNSWKRDKDLEHFLTG